MTEISNITPTLTPHLVCDGAADAIEFYKKAFGAEELMRIPGQDGKLMHACVAINGAMLMLMDEMKEMGALSPKTLGGTPVTLHIHATDADAAIARAEAAGATVVMPASDMFWGDRYGVVKDPFGHSWSIAHPLRDTVMSEAELRAAALDATCGQPAPATA
ncbi:VOC family protein [Sphingosinicella sp. LHD-64]|uniref:VOC family protein n=1 Tax=Sphingosinicella sp. LHD-64 TaxID=3072139 RepID=UPI0028108535|nr:VOC family protein [Sphingosinicella sp. LHD-64]MDQ8756836.1 VOC family protein [Sphingosinicella sp. LHD-64]